MEEDNPFESLGEEGTDYITLSQTDSCLDLARRTEIGVLYSEAAVQLSQMIKGWVDGERSDALLMVFFAQFATWFNEMGYRIMQEIVAQGLGAKMAGEAEKWLNMTTEEP